MCEQRSGRQLPPPHLHRVPQSLPWVRMNCPRSPQPSSRSTSTSTTWRYTLLCENRFLEEPSSDNRPTLFVCLNSPVHFPSWICFGKQQEINSNHKCTSDIIKTTPLSQQEALQCVQELNSTQLLYLFVKIGVESTLERSTITREHMGQLLLQLIKTGILPTTQYYKGLVWTQRLNFFLSFAAAAINQAFIHSICAIVQKIQGINVKIQKGCLYSVYTAVQCINKYP